MFFIFLIFFIKNKIKDKMSNLSTEDIQYLLKNILCYYPDKILQQAVIAYLVYRDFTLTISTDITYLTKFDYKSTKKIDELNNNNEKF